MSEQDTNDVTSANDDRPIVLVIGNEGAQNYLTPQNEVLAALYDGVVPVRLQVCTEPYLDVAWELFFPIGQGPERELALLKRFSHVPAANMPMFLQSAQFYDAVFQYMWGDRDPEDIDLVKVILASRSMYNEGFPLREVIKFYFSNATAFAVDGRSMPERVNLHVIEEQYKTKVKEPDSSDE